MHRAKSVLMRLTYCGEQKQRRNSVSSMTLDYICSILVIAIYLGKTEVGLGVCSSLPACLTG